MLFRAWLAMAMTLGGLAAEPPVVYVSAAGDDGASGLGAGAAWRSLSRVQQALKEGLFSGGGEIRLERGGVFEGSLAVTNLALGAGEKLLITGYGEGRAPVIRGMTALRDWEDVGGGRWRARCGACAAMPGVVTRNGAVMPVARWPNGNEYDEGYLYYQSAEGRTSIRDEMLAGGVDWTGGEAVVRSAAWILDRLPIVSHSGATLTFGAPASYAIPKGYGYFIQNHMGALDRDGEWVWDAAGRTITVFLDGTRPEEHEFAAAVTETLVAVTGSAGVEIRGVRLEGARRANLEIQRSERVRVEEVESVQAGDVGLRCLNCGDLVVENCRIDEALNHGLDVYACTDCRVEGNRITNTATIAGLGRSGNGQYNGVRFGGVNAVFARNVVARSGYLGVDVRGGARIEGNVVSEPNLVKTDGGGIYTWGNRGVEVLGNLVRNGVGSKAGVPWNNPATHGIYIDDQCEDVRVEGNTVVGVASYGVYLHNTRRVAVERNTLVDAGEAQIAYIDDNLGTYTVSETVVRDNVMVARRAGSLMARASTVAGGEFFTSIGQLAGNRYCAPFGEAVFSTSSAGGQARMRLGQWQALTGGDADAKGCPRTYAPYEVEQVEGGNRVANGTFDRDIGSWFGWPGGQFEAAWDNGRLRLRHTAVAPSMHFDAPVGGIEKGRHYRVRFDAQSEAPGRAMSVYLRKWDPDYRRLGAAQDLWLDERAGGWEWVVEATESEARSLLIFELPNASPAVWLDNVVLEPVRARAADREGLVRVEVNETLEPVLMVLKEERLDVSGQLLAVGSVVEVGPLSVVVLFAAR